VLQAGKPIAKSRSQRIATEKPIENNRSHALPAQFRTFARKELS
jgi:hypothetical protein